MPKIIYFLFFFICLFGSALPSFADIAPSADVSIQQDKLQDELPPWKLGIELQKISDEFSFYPKASSGDANLLRYRPPTSSYFGFFAGYRFLGGTLLFSSKTSGDMQKLEGIGTYSSLGFTCFLQKVALSFSYSKFKGFLIDNSTRLSPSTLAGDTYYKLPDMYDQSFGFNFYFPFKHETFSLPALLDQTEIQRKSAGTWLLLGAVRWQQVGNIGPIIPKELQSQYGPDSALSFNQMYTASFGGGYAHMWHSGDFFIAPLLGAGLGYVHSHWEGEGMNETKSSATINYNFKLSMGWNFPTYFLAVLANYDGYTEYTNSMMITYSPAVYSLSGGYRF